MTAVDVDALDAARAAATPGPWHHYDPDDGMCWEGAADAALIVAAVNALPDLLAAVRERDALREIVRELCDSAADGYVPVTWLRAALAAVDGGEQR